MNYKSVDQPSFFKIMLRGLSNRMYKSKPDLVFAFFNKKERSKRTMKKFFATFITFLTVIVLLIGCSNEPTTPKTEETEQQIKEEVVVITISKDNQTEIITEKEVPISDHDLLMEVMKENFDIEEDGGFIQSIDGIQPENGEEKAWIYYVNGELAMVGATEYVLIAGDKILFDLQAWE